MIEIANLHEQYLSIKEEIDSAIADVICRSAFVGSKAVAKFEDAFAVYTGAKHCVAVANGTDALEIAIEALELHGKKIVVPAMTAVPTVEAVIRTGNIPVFCDVDRTCTIDAYELERIVREQSISAIIPVHLFGAPANMVAIERAAHANNIVIIEDCAQAHGTMTDGIHVGTTGVAGCFSFYPGKNLGAFGDGGAIITNSEALAEKYRMIRDHGRSGKFDHAIVGRNSRLDGIQAAVLEVKLRHLDDWIAARQANAAYYNEFIGEWVMLPEWRNDSARYTYHQYPVLAPQRDGLLAHLHGKGIEAGKHYPFALPNLAPYKQYSDGNYIIAQLIADNEISLPIHEMLSYNDLNAVILAVESFYERF